MCALVGGSKGLVGPRSLRSRGPIINEFYFTYRDRMSPALVKQSLVNIETKFLY